MIVQAKALETEQWFLHCNCGAPFSVDDFIQNGAVLKRGKEAFAVLSHDDGEQHESQSC